MPNFAIIFPVFNTEKYVGEAINSLLSQTFQNFTIFAIDDCSTDNSSQILDQVAKSDRRVKVFHLPTNVGVCEARNFALAEIEKDTSFTHILFIDSDDLVEPHLLQKITTIVDKNSQLVEYLVFGFNFLTLKGVVGRKFPTDTIQLRNQHELIQQILQSSFWKKRCYSNWSLCNKVFSTNLLKGLRFKKNMKLGEDIEFLCRATQKARQGYFLGEVLYHYRIRNSSATHSRQKNYSRDIEALFQLQKSFSQGSKDLQHLINTVIYRNVFSLYLRTVFYDLPEEVSIFREKYIPIAWSLFLENELKTVSELFKYGCCVFMSPQLLSKLFSSYQSLRAFKRGEGFS